MPHKMTERKSKGYIPLSDRTLSPPGTADSATNLKIPKYHFPIWELLITFDKLLIFESNCEENASRVLGKTF